MFKTMLRSKIHRATVTRAELDYEGSITIDHNLIDAAGMLPYEQVMISNLNNGERFETYLIPGKRGGGMVCLNGPTARKGMVGDKIIVFCYELYSVEELKKHRPTVVRVDEHNRVVGS